MSEKSANIIWIVVGVLVGVAAGYFLTAPTVKAPASENEVVVSENISSEEAVSEEIVLADGEVDLSQ
jgi:uncharacterized membrane protein YdfJ with MMPL/SSD domain